VFCLCLCALVAFTSGSTARAGSIAATAGCTDPVVHDRYDGFRVGVPTGWDLSSTGGLIVVQKGFTGQTEGVVQTAFLGPGQSNAKFLSAILSSLSKRVSSGANSLSFRITGATTASLSGRVGSIAISGQASVSVAAVASAHGSRLGVLSAYWAPSSQLGGERRLLAGIGACFAPEQGTLFRLFKDQVFAYALPPGWRVGGEQQDSLFLDDGTIASANFLLVGPFAATTTGVTDARSLVNYSFPRLGIKLGTVLASVSAPNQTTVTGAVQQEELIEFTGVNGGQAVKGMVRVISSTGGGVTSGVLRIAMARTSDWNALNGGALWILYGIQHDFTQDERSILHTQQQLAGFAQQVGGFDQAIDGTDIVQDPSTGAQYEAPYSSFNRSGPQGPGYYTGSAGNLTKLNVVTP
jgi:hypothetical protein